MEFSVRFLQQKGPDLSLSILLGGQSGECVVSRLPVDHEPVIDGDGNGLPALVEHESVDSIL